MQILVNSNASSFEEVKQKFGVSHTYVWAKDGSEVTRNLDGVEVVFDFAPTKYAISLYSEFGGSVFLNSSFTTLAELINLSGSHKRVPFIGFCGMPMFLNRSVLEVTLMSKRNEENLRQVCTQLGTDFVCVEDRVGMVTPRVICMIINEAYCTLEEGTATRENIDLAMKLGTNYPFGPFEWALRIGISQVIKLLDVVYHDTNDDRYKVCDLLRSEMNN